MGKKEKVREIGTKMELVPNKSIPIYRTDGMFFCMHGAEAKFKGCSINISATVGMPSVVVSIYKDEKSPEPRRVGSFIVKAEDILEVALRAGGVLDPEEPFELTFKKPKKDKSK